MSLDENKEKTERCKRAFERKIENAYDIEIHNGMTCIHGNKVNKIYECNLLQDMINNSKQTKTLNIHYSPILHVCMNTQKGRSELKNFLILLNSGYSYTIIMVSRIKNLLLKKTL